MKKTLKTLSAIAILACCLTACSKTKANPKDCCHEKASCCEEKVEAKDCCKEKKDCCEDKAEVKDCCDEDQKKADSLGAGCCG